MSIFTEEVFPPSPEPKKKDYDNWYNNVDSYEDSGWYYNNILEIAQTVKVGSIVSGIDTQSKEAISGVVEKIDLNQIPAYTLYILNNGKSLFAHEINRWASA